MNRVIRCIMNRTAPGAPQRPVAANSGFTLIELAIALVISGILSVALVQMLQVGRKSAERNRSVVDMQQNARVGLESLTDDLRHVSYGKDPTQPSIHYAGPDSVTFIADVLPENAGAEKISFFLSRDGDPDTPNPYDTVLMRVVTDTAGVPLISAPQAYGVAQGGLTFRWYNGGGIELPNPVPQPEQVGEIFVGLRTVAPEDVRGTYASMTLSTTIYPRNLPLSPARSRPSPPGTQAPSYPNCESATITWATPTTNTDGTELPLTDISHFCLYFGSSPTDMTLYTKLARTINLWTLTGLTAGQTYYISVTCVSRSGVESYRSTQTADMSSVFQPQAVASCNTTGWNGAGVQLDWPPVTLFTNGDPITTPVTYHIYRSTTPGFTPDDTNQIAAVAGTSYVDTTVTTCATMNYQVCAVACGNEGASGPEVSGSLPAPPSCPTGLIADNTAPGEVQMSWSAPVNRMDGTALDPADIQGYRVYADTFPGNTTLRTEVTGGATAATLTGLTGCDSWYLNVQCVDECSHSGDICPVNEISLFVASPCDQGPPVAPPSLQLTALDDQVQLEWPVNTTDCDLGHYLVYYGAQAGGPYNGTQAQQGPSPIQLTPDQVTEGNVCRFSLTGLGVCETYHCVITAADLCSPPSESARSPEANGTTTCIPCNVSASCIAWAAPAPGYSKIHLEVYSASGTAETVTRLTPTWQGTTNISEVWCGRPLVKIWSGDGTAGEDGNIGPQPSGRLLNIDDVTVPDWTEAHDGQPFALVFDGEVRDVPMTLTFRGLNGNCAVTGTARATPRYDNFDDGNYNGWTVLGGSWTVAAGELKESATASNYIVRDQTLTMGDLTMEGKISVSAGSQRQAFLMFRYQDPSNYYLCGIRTDTDHVYVARVRSGTFTAIGDYPTPLSDDVWYDIRVVATGQRAQVWLDCQRVLDVTDNLMWLSGGVGLSTRKAAAKFDDVRVLTGAVLP